jgi:Growth-Arrest-Specific Protein 2 Domain
MPLEEQISNILDAIPTPIKFRSGPNANDPQIKSSRFRSTSSQLRRAAANLTHNAPILTLAPADEQKPRRNANDPDIRLYHLIQTGRDKPIKLFIRRVGENGDRVMVRVGGGWADLAEYLRIYAEHHGRRAVSDGRVEIQPLAGAVPGSSTPKASSSRRSSMLSQSRPGSTTPMAEPGSRPASAMSSPQNYLDTPQSASVGAASRRLASWDEAGLAGPFAKRAGVSDEKKEWIDGIVEQAKRSMGNIDVGELGKSGSTRRVFLKGKSPAPDS